MQEKDDFLRAVSITHELSDFLRNRPGPFTFPEFLTSFEEGGHGSYDVDAIDGEPRILEGHFRVVSVTGCLIEAEELISEQRVWPIVLPEKAAQLIAPGYVLDLEITRQGERWVILDAGTAYPPGTPLSGM